MLVRMTTHITGYRDGVEWPPTHGLLEVPDAEAADLIAAGYAVADDGLREADGAGVPMDGIEWPDDGTVSPTITGDGSGTALPPAGPDPGDSTGITHLEESDGPAAQHDPADGPDATAAGEHAPDPADGPDAATAERPDLDALDRDQLITLAAERGVEVSARWGEKRLRAALA